MTKTTGYELALVSVKRIEPDEVIAPWWESGTFVLATEGGARIFSDLEAEALNEGCLYAAQDGERINAVDINLLIARGNERDHTEVAFYAAEPVYRLDASFQPNGMIEYEIEEGYLGVLEALNDATKAIFSDENPPAHFYVALYETWTVRHPGEMGGPGDWESGFDLNVVVLAANACEVIERYT